MELCVFQNFHSDLETHRGCKYHADLLDEQHIIPELEAVWK